MISVLAQAQDMAEQRKMLMTNMMRKSTPKATHSHSSQEGWIPSHKAATDPTKISIKSLSPDSEQVIHKKGQSFAYILDFS
jgi:hypothetical protein